MELDRGVHWRARGAKGNYTGEGGGVELDRGVYRRGRRRGQLHWRCWKRGTGGGAGAYTRGVEKRAVILERVEEWSWKGGYTGKGLRRWQLYWRCWKRGTWGGAGAYTRGMEKRAIILERVEEWSWTGAYTGGGGEEVIYTGEGVGEELWSVGGPGGWPSSMFLWQGC